jgi:hypothetical protein
VHQGAESVRLWTGPVLARLGKHVVPNLPDDLPIRMFVRRVQVGSSLLIDGRRVAGRVRCTTGGALPSCDGEEITIDLFDLPEEPGLHLLQVQTPRGIQSNEFPIRTAR